MNNFETILPLASDTLLNLLKTISILLLFFSLIFCQKLVLYWTGLSGNLSMVIERLTSLLLILLMFLTLFKINYGYKLSHKHQNWAQKKKKKRDKSLLAKVCYLPQAKKFSCFLQVFKELLGKYCDAGNTLQCYHCSCIL